MPLPKIPVRFPYSLNSLPFSASGGIIAGKRERDVLKDISYSMFDKGFPKEYYQLIHNRYE